MRHLILVSLLLAALTYCASETIRDYSTYTFPQYLKEHQKTYNTTEYIFRKSLFEKKLREIITHNKNPTYSWKLGVNQFTDMTEAERRAYRGLNKALLYQTQSRRGIIPPLAAPVDPALKARLPDAVDWRTKGVITNVKNQGACGSCWSFGAAECVESVVAQKTGSLTVLSEQNILDCTPNPHHCGGTGGCGGGTVELAWDKIKEEGIATEKDYPYKSGSSGRDYKCNTGFNVFTNISGYVNLPPNQQGPLLDALANIGPLAINVDASRWSDYGSGVFDGCNQKSPDIDHVVQLVGYGTDPKHGDYWLIRNSWGTGYGEKGYIRIRKEDTPRCGTDTKPDDGTGCDDGPPTVNVCGTCGVLFDALYPLKN